MPEASSNGEVREPAWWEKLRQPFEARQISALPRVTCGDCRENKQAKVCGRHSLIHCDGCGQYISEKHIHLDYVGHADATDRLIKTDPHWAWWPAHTAVDKDVLLAAIGTGNADIVESVIRNAPPLTDSNGGMWICLAVHDDEGRPVERLGYGFADGKRGGDAVKEVIGDALRNAGMRFGIALDLWSKSEKAEEAADGQEKPRSKPVGGKTVRKAQAAPESPQIDVETQALADLAYQLVREGGTEEELRAQVYEPARKKRILRSPVKSPDGDTVVQLSVVVQAAKQQIIDSAERVPEPAEAAGSEYGE